MIIQFPRKKKNLTCAHLYVTWILGQGLRQLLVHQEKSEVVRF